MKTTNELLSETIENINQLISWANADSEHAKESKDEESEADADNRIAELNKSLGNLTLCFKQ